jgi:PhnB protein
MERVMQINPYLTFNGQCAAAFEFYVQCLGGKIVAKLTYGQTPMAKQMPPEWHNKIAHARLMVGDKLLMGSDSPPEHYEAMKGFSVTLNVADPAEADRLFHALAEKGTVRMPIQKTFWSVRFGTLVDRFGTPWMINCEQVP